MSNNVSPPLGEHRWSEGCSDIDSQHHSQIGSISIGTWNVEGITDIKIEQVIDYMEQYSIAVVCIQETRKLKSDVFFTDRGFQVVYSGGSISTKEWAGVGFIISPKLQKSVVYHLDHFPPCASPPFRIVGVP